MSVRKPSTPFWLSRFSSGCKVRGSIDVLRGGRAAAADGALACNVRSAFLKARLPESACARELSAMPLEVGGLAPPRCADGTLCIAGSANIVCGPGETEKGEALSGGKTLPIAVTPRTPEVDRRGRTQKCPAPLGKQIECPCPHCRGRYSLRHSAPDLQPGLPSRPKWTRELSRHVGAVADSCAKVFLRWAGSPATPRPSPSAMRLLWRVAVDDVRIFSCGGVAVDDVRLYADVRRCWQLRATSCEWQWRQGFARF